MGIFTGSQNNTGQKKRTGGIFSGISAGQTKPVTQKPYAGIDSRGFSTGFSEERDTSGRPYFAYRNPGDTATTTDYKRTATTINPRVATTTSRDTIYNPRKVEITDNNPANELDHEMALALSGSNNPKNLRSIPAEQNNDSEVVRRLQGEVLSGKKSLAQAQADLAIAKGTELPVTGSRYGQFKVEANKLEEEAKKASSPWGIFKNTVKGIIPTAIKGMEKVGQKVSEALPGIKAVSDTIVQRDPQILKDYAKYVASKEHAQKFSAFNPDGSLNKEKAIDLTMGFINPVAPESRIVSKLVKEKTIQGVRKLLQELGGYSKSTIDELAPQLTKSNTVSEVTSILKNSGKAKPKIVQEDLFEMRDFTDYVNGAYKPKNAVQLEIDARRIAEQYGINPNQGNRALSNQFGKILDEKLKLDDVQPRDPQGRFSQKEIKNTEIPSKTAPISNTSTRIIDSSIPQKKGMFRTALDNLKDPRTRQGGYIKNPLADGADELRRVELDNLKQAVDNHPAKPLAKYANKYGELPEVLGGVSGKFAKGGDDIATQLGFPDSETARRSYADYLIGKKRLETLKSKTVTQKQLAKADVDRMFAERERRMAREYVDRKMTEREVPKTTSAPSKPIRPIEATPGEVRSIEIQAKRAIDISNGAPVPPGESLHNIISKTVTPVEKKVNIVDTFLRTPDRVMNKIGFGKEAKMLRSSMNEYWKELPKNIDMITEWSKRVGKDSNERIFKWLDGQAIDLRPEELAVANEIKSWLAQWADRLKLPKDNRLSHYITHIFDKELIAKEFDEDLAKIIADKIPGSVYDPFLLKRLGAKGYKQDTWAALDAYVKRGTRKAHMDPVLEKIKEKAGASLDMSNIEETQYEFLKRAIDNINMRPTKIDKGFDNFIKSIPRIGGKMGQRPVTAITRLFRQFSYVGMLGGNVGSALRNLSQGANTYAVLGEKHTVIGYAKLLNKGSFDELTREGVLNAGFIQDRTLSAVKSKFQKFNKALFIFFDIAEKINRGAAYFGGKSKGLAEGMSEKEAIEYAKEVVRKTQFLFDSIDTPVGLNSDIMKTFFQMQTFTVKQTEFLTEMAMNKDIVGLARYGLAGLAFVYTIGQAFGMEPKDIIPMFRIGTPPSLKLPVEATKAVLGANDKYGNPRDLKKKVTDVAKSVIGLIPGGIQAKKTFEGIKAIQEGGSYDKAGRLQFKVGTTPMQKVQATLFGKYSGKGAKDFFNPDVDLLKDEAIKLDQELQGMSRTQANKKALEIKKSNPQLYAKLKVVIDERVLNLTKEDIKMRNLGVLNGDRARYVNELIMSLPEGERKAKYNELKKKKVITPGVDKQLKEMRK